MSRRASAAALLLLTVAACSGGSSKTAAPSPTPTPTPTASPTPVAPAATARNVRASVRNIAVAEETYYTDNVKYTAFVGTVPGDLLDVDPIPVGAKAGVALIGKDGYCIVEFVAARNGFVVYDSTKGGILPATSTAKDLKPSCLALVRALAK